MLKNKKGFTLVEIVVVIAILVVLLAVLSPFLHKYVENSRIQRDDSAMDEVCNSVQLAMADSATFDEVFSYSIPNNYTTYTDSSGVYGARYTDEEFWAPDGSGRTVTITFNPNENGDYELAKGIVNNMTSGNGSVAESRTTDTAKTCNFEDMGNQKLYTAVKKVIDSTIYEKSATYKNSSYTVFINFELANGIYRAEVNGSFNGTNLSPDSPSAPKTTTSADLPDSTEETQKTDEGTTPPIIQDSDLNSSGIISSDGGSENNEHTVYVDGIGNVKIEGIEDIENSDIMHDENSGELKVEKLNESNEKTELSVEDVVTIIDFDYGYFKTDTSITPGTSTTVSYEESYTVIKEPVEYRIGSVQSWYLTPTTTAIQKTLADVASQDRTYIAYAYCNQHAKANNVFGKSVVWGRTENKSEDTLENTIFLAAYLNETNIDSSIFHIAQWDGSQYVAVDYDTQIANTLLTETKTRTVTKNVSIPGSIDTRYVFIPAGTLNAESGMTWAEWLDSDYNTTGETAPIIKTANFQDVSYNDVIVANQEYGFVQCEISGVWKMNEVVNLTLGQVGAAYWETVNYTSGGKTFAAMAITPTEVGYVAGFFPMSLYKQDTGWSQTQYQSIDFGTTKQPVTYEFYEWLTANATAINRINFTIDGTTYQAEEGMTWAKWVESDYNTNNTFVINDDATLGGATISRAGDSSGATLKWQSMVIRTGNGPSNGTQYTCS